MVQPLDTGIIDKIQSFADYQKANQDFLLKRQLLAQQLQSGNIDAQTKANVFATQVLSAAAANGNQDEYNRGLQTLQQNGIDTSAWSPDVREGSQQVQAAKLAQSPLGALFGMQQKVIGNNIAATNTFGGTENAANAGYIQPVPSLNINPLNGTATVNPTVQPQPVNKPANNSTVPASVPVSVPDLPPSVTPEQIKLADANGGLNGITPNQTKLTNGGIATTQTPEFTFTPNPQKTQAANEADRKTALELYNNRPDVIAAKEQAKSYGSDSGKYQQELKESLPSASAALTTAILEAQKQLDTINNLRDKLKNGTPALGAAYSRLPTIRTDTADTEADIDKLDASNFLQSIKALKDASPKGATGLGALTETEGAKVQKSNFNFTKAQSEARFGKELDKYEAQIKASTENTIKKFNDTYGTNYKANDLYNKGKADFDASKNAIPQGASLIGTSDGKKIYQLPNGQHIMEQ